MSSQRNGQSPEIGVLHRNDVNPAKVAPEFKDDALTVHLMKDEKAKPHQVEVKVY